MRRLTTDAPKGNFETMLNLVFGKESWAHIRCGGEGESVPLTQWAKAQCILHGCGEFPAETPEEIDEALCDCSMDVPDCPVGLAYSFAIQAVHLRSRLKQYEDILYAEDGSERLTLEQLRNLAALRTQPHTLDRSSWEGCYECSAPVCASCVFDWVDDEEEPCFSCAGGLEYEPREYCSKCGRPLTEEAWAELERRIGGNDGTADG